MKRGATVRVVEWSIVEMAGFLLSSVWGLGFLWALSGVIAAFAAGKPGLWRITIWFGPLSFFLFPSKHPEKFDSPISPASSAPPQPVKHFFDEPVSPPVRVVKRTKNTADVLGTIFIYAVLIGGPLLVATFFVALIYQDFRFGKPNESSFPTNQFATQPKAGENNDADQSLPSPVTSNLKWWSFGSDKATVYRIQGQPRTVDRNLERGQERWEYDYGGKRPDEIVFDLDTNEVSGWFNHSGNLLVAIILDGKIVQRQSDAVFGVGSSREDVARAQGIPNSLTVRNQFEGVRELWEYGGGFVLFDRKTGKVVLCSNRNGTLRIREAESQKPVVPEKASTTNPVPSQNIGEVRVVSKTTDGLCEIRFESSAGLEKGKRLRVFRENPISRTRDSVGSLEIVAVKENVIVGRCNATTLVQVGDIVVAD